MSKTINSYYFAGGGGGGGVSEQDAVLMATVPAGSTVTATKGGVTLAPSMWVSGSDSSLEKAMFVFSTAQFDSVNPWTITATLDSNTASAEVLIATNKEYEVEISFGFYLFKSGVGLASGYSVVRKDGTIATDENEITVTSAYGNKAFMVITPNIRDISKYNSIRINVKNPSSVAGNLYWGITANSNMAITSGTWIRSKMEPTSAIFVDSVLDISGTTGSEVYFACGHNNGNHVSEITEIVFMM